MSSKLAHSWVPWNSVAFFLLNLMEPLVSSKLWVFHLDRIPSTFELPNFDVNYIQFCLMNQFPEVNKHTVSFRMSLSPTYVLLSICVIPHEVSALRISIKLSFNSSFQCSSKFFSSNNFHGTIPRVPWNISNNIWKTSVVPWNFVELKEHNPKLDGIPWNFVQILSSMEFHRPFSILPTSGTNFS